VGDSPKHTNPANGWNLYANFGYFWDGTANVRLFSLLASSLEVISSAFGDINHGTE